MNGSDFILISISSLAVVVSVAEFIRIVLFETTENVDKIVSEDENDSKLFQEMIISYIDSLNSQELLVVAQAINDSIDDKDEFKLFFDIIEVFENADFNDTICEKLRNFIKEKLLSFSSEELKLFKDNYVNLHLKDKSYQKKI